MQSAKRLNRHFTVIIATWLNFKQHFLFGIPPQTSSIISTLCSSLYCRFTYSVHLGGEEHIEKQKSPIAINVGTIRGRQFCAHVARKKLSSYYIKIGSLANNVTDITKIMLSRYSSGLFLCVFISTRKVNFYK